MAPALKEQGLFKKTRQIYRKLSDSNDGDNVTDYKHNRREERNQPGRFGGSGDVIREEARGWLGLEKLRRGGHF